MNIQALKLNLSRVFDDKLKTKQWHNILDYVIIGLIIISTLEVFLSTYSSIVERYGKWLHFVDYFTTIFFTIEVTLRIWCADLIDPKYKGFIGRVRYCFSFYGLIDILSTYPFYLHFFMPVPYMALKVLRIARLLRVFRYMKAFSILSRAFAAKKNEMVVSLQFLTIVTLILSFVLFFVENEAQPDVYTNGWKSVVWSFAQYIGDPGGFADTPPITFVGRIIACVIGVLGIAIFAVPAGLIGSAFTEIMEEDKKEEQINGFIRSIVQSFKFLKDQQHTNLFYVPRYLPLDRILTRKYITHDQIVEAVQASDCLHLYNLQDSVNEIDNPVSNIVLFNYVKNRPYGCCIDRGSRITIVCTSGTTEPCTSWFAYHIAKLGNFNFVSKEIETDIDNPTTYYTISDVNNCPNLSLFLEDINHFASRENSWVIPILAATGPKSRPHQIHFCYNPTKGDTSYDNPNSKVTDFVTFDKLYQSLSTELDNRYGYKSDKNIWYAVNKQNVAHYIKADNIFTMRVEAFVWLFDNRFLETTKCIADTFHAVLEPEKEQIVPPEMLTRIKGHDFGMKDYVD
jgi:voltage-gated potassium channel